MKLIILDRDGVINKDLIGQYVDCADKFEFIDGSVLAIAKLKKAGFKIAIATNQAGIAKGIYTHEDLAKIHNKMLKILRQNQADIDRIIYCDSKDDNHPWKKPNAGMLLEILKEYPNYKKPVYFIGDMVRDNQAAIAANCKPILLRTGNGKKQQFEIPKEMESKIEIFDDLLQAVNEILERENK